MTDAEHNEYLMRLRDKFAMHAPDYPLAINTYQSATDILMITAQWRYAYADMMLRERKSGLNEDPTKPTQAPVPAATGPAVAPDAREPDRELSAAWISPAPKPDRELTEQERAVMEVYLKDWEKRT